MRYKIKILNNNNKCWVGHSNASDWSGFFATSIEKKAIII